MSEWSSFVRGLKPGDVLKWGGVVLAYVLGLLLVISIVLTMVDSF